jgi:hypothetical protein
MSTELADLWVSFFHGCTWAALIDHAAEEQGWPDSEKTRKRAYRYYEEELAKRNRHQDGTEPQQQPRHTAAGLMDQCYLSAPIPDEDRTSSEAALAGCQER